MWNRFISLQTGLKVHGCWSRCGAAKGSSVAWLAVRNIPESKVKNLPGLSKYAT